MGEAAGTATPPQREACCVLYHEAVELIGKRWTGAIVAVLLEGPARFSEIRECVPALSDRLLSERQKGMALGPAVDSLKSWARTWLD